MDGARELYDPSAPDARLCPIRRTSAFRFLQRILASVREASNARTRWLPDVARKPRRPNAGERISQHANVAHEMGRDHRMV